ncbi:hypothetical protein, partial [Enterobacter cloacae complex sp. 4DZ1-17B1]|uniref:hypothetical protein n=1 Tax=Enterobacter cloacae complex sp. 4DZ1-17B1 TaxID=2511991 RepID=UPI001CA49CC3
GGASRNLDASHQDTLGRVLYCYHRRGGESLFPYSKLFTFLIIPASVKARHKLHHSHIVAKNHTSNMSAAQSEEKPSYSLSTSAQLFLLW